MAGTFDFAKLYSKPLAFTKLVVSYEYKILLHNKRYSITPY